MSWVQSPIIAERIWAKRRIRKPVKKEGVDVEEARVVGLPCIGVSNVPAALGVGSGGRVEDTFDRASAMAATMIPSVSMVTLNTCILVYLFPQIKPTSIVVTLPPLRRMMCTGTEMS